MACLVMHYALLTVLGTPSTAQAACDASDAAILQQRRLVCRSLVQGYTPWCQDDWQNVTAAGDWPNQAVYMHDLLELLADERTCLNTTYARATVSWLNSSSMANATVSGNFMWTYSVFQVQYYDMPRAPGTRIEAPDTLGRKCWAMAYLAQTWAALGPRLEDRTASAGLSIAGWATEYQRASPLTMALCQKVVCNCFVNASYDPTRSGGCRLKVDAFHYLGFDREAAHWGRPHDIQYAWHEHCG
jgi:hypothetical protein